MTIARIVLLATILVAAAACDELTLVEVEESPPPPPVEPTAYFVVDYLMPDSSGRVLYASASLRAWGAAAPSVFLGPIRLDDQWSNDGNHSMAVYDTVAAEAPASLAVITLTPPDAPLATPDTIELPTLQRFGGAVVCADSSGIVALGVVVGGPADSTRVSWNVTISDPTDTISSLAVSWRGTTDPTIAVPLVALPPGDTLAAVFYVGVDRTSRTSQGLRVMTHTSLAERYSIVPQIGC